MSTNDGYSKVNWDILKKLFAKFQYFLVLGYHKVFIDWKKINLVLFIFSDCILDEIRHRLCAQKHLLGGGEGEARHQE